MPLLPLLRRGIAAIALAALCTCGTIDRLEVGASADAQIPKATLLEELLGAVDFDGFDELDFSREIANQGVSEDQIDSVRIKSFTLGTTEGSGQTLDFIQSLEVHAVADGLEDVILAEGSNFAGKSSVELTVHDDVELEAYVSAPSLTLEVKVKGKRPSEDTAVHADVVLAVDATIPGCE